ncbi:MAG: hypothetical protein IPI46_13650 [Bacteroidetes bacterium]|nr:hypothetical protein [Bacteroidota bacterium]
MKFKNLFIDDVQAELEEQEILLLTSHANLFRDVAIGGELSLTSRRLIFKPHIFNFDRREEKINIDEIRGVRKVKTFSIIDTSICVTTDDFNEFKFVLGSERDKWFDILTSKID